MYIVGMEDWVRIAEDIERNYDYYDAFIILHGTDTMAYTASALSFMLENLGKPIILTGSQVPILVSHYAPTKKHRSRKQFQLNFPIVEFPAMKMLCVSILIADCV